MTPGIARHFLDQLIPVLSKAKLKIHVVTDFFHNPLQNFVYIAIL